MNKKSLINGLAVVSMLMFLTYNNTVAQNIAINSTGTAANASSMLDISAGTGNNRGLLIPRVTSAQKTAMNPLPAAAQGLTVYQTDGVQGFYYNTSTTTTPAWSYLSPSTGWSILGNAGTAVATNFVGTTDNVDLAFRVNNTERMRILSANGRVGIGTTAPGYLLEVSSGAADAIYGHSTNVGGFIGYETNFTVGTAGTINGAGLYAANPSAGYASTYAQSTGAATVAANINFSSVWIASYNLVDNTSATVNPPASYAQLNVTSTTLGGTHIGLSGYSNRGATAGNPGYSVGIQGISNAQNQDGIAVIGQAYTTGVVRVGGYFEGLNYVGTSQAYAYVGGTTNSGTTMRKIVGTGTVSEIIPTPNHGRVTLTCPESPEYWYQDYGTVQLVNGKAHVDLDPILSDIIFVNAENPLRVFCTPVDMLNFNGVAITNRTEKGFDIVELNGGTNSGTLDYQIVVKPKTNYGEGRFPQAPGPSWLKESEEPVRAKAKNNPADGRQIFHWAPDAEVYQYQGLAKKRMEEQKQGQKLSKEQK